MLLLLDIVTTAAILFIVAVGLLAIFGVLKIINFAHGAWLTIGGYCAVVVAKLGLNPWAALPLAFVAGGILGGVAELFIIRPLYRRPLDAILATWGLGIVIGQLITLAFGRDVQLTPSLLSGTVPLLGVDYSAYRLFTLVAALIIGAAFALTIEGTRLGLSARAVIMNETLARSLGIDTGKVRLATFMIGAGLAALAGVLLTPMTSVDPTMGVAWLIGAFMLVMVADTSYAALAVACLVFGGVQVLVSTFVSPVLGSISVAVLAALVLRVSPRGFSVLEGNAAVLEHRPKRVGPTRLWLTGSVALAGALVVWFAPFLLGTFAVNVLTRSMLYAVLAVTVDLLWGFTGILTFGQSAFFGVGAYATAMVLTQLGSTPGWMAGALALAIIMPMVLGLVVGWLSFYHGSTPLYASVISLVVPIVVTQLVYSGGTLTGSSSGLVGYETLPLELEGFFRLAGIVLVAVTLAAWIFVRSDAGKLLIAVRDNDVRCAYLGLNPKRIQILLTVALAGVAGLTGFLFAQASGVVAPENTGFLFGTELVIWVALGGRGSLLGPVLGAIAIDYLSASLSGDLPFLWQLVLGAAFVVIIILLPDGLAGLVRRAFTAVSGLRGTASVLHVEAATVARHPVSDGGPLLNVTGLARSFGSLSVLQDITLQIRPGELVSIVGPNGAGKTTLMRCLSDGTEPFKGSVEIAGKPIAGLTPDRVVALGVGRKFQVASIFESLTVAECLKLARMSAQAPSAVGTAPVLTLPPSSAEILRLTGLSAEMATPARLLSHGLKQGLELAMVLALEPRLILLDEPTAGLTKAERTTVGTVLRHLTTQAGFAAILVEHDLDFVRDISTRIVVLHQGRLVLDGTVDEVVNSETVRTIYAGGGHV